jgi:hypothetical protein
MELRRIRCWCLCLSALFVTLQLRADVTGSISGYVRDKSGAVLAGDTVTIVQQATGYTRAAKTDAAGQYRFLALPSGRYRLTAILDTFQRGMINDIDLNANDQLHFDVSLKVGSIVESVSVEANKLQVQTESTQLGTTIQSNQILALPLNGRSYLDLLSLLAGLLRRTRTAISTIAVRLPASILPRRQRRATSRRTASLNMPMPFW